MSEKVSALFCWFETGEETGRKFAQAYQTAGMQTKIHGQATQTELIQLGEAAGTSHVLYFLDDKRVLLVSLKDEMGGFTVEITTDDLVLP